MRLELCDVLSGTLVVVGMQRDLELHVAILRHGTHVHHRRKRPTCARCGVRCDRGSSAIAHLDPNREGVVGQRAGAHELDLEGIPQQLRLTG